MFTLIDAGRPVEVPARIQDGRVRLSREAVKTALGVEPEIPNAGGEVDLAELAAALDRPLAIDPEEHAAYLGVAARQRADALASLQAPDFTLPDLGGGLHSLSDQRGKKVLLVVYAAW